MAQRVGRGIALLFHDSGTRKGASGQQHAPAALYPRERPGTHFTGGWVGPSAGLDGRKTSNPPGFDPGSSSDTEHKVWILQIRKEGRKKEREIGRLEGRKDRTKEGSREIKI